MGVARARTIELNNQAYLPYIANAVGAYWGLSGNAATDPVTNYLGTTDGKALIVQPGAGRVGIGTTNPTDGKLYVAGGGGSGIVATSNSTSGVWGESSTGVGVTGYSTQLNGVEGLSRSATYAGVNGTNLGTGPGVSGVSSGSGQPGVRGVNAEENGIGVRGEANAPSSVGVYGKSDANTGVYGQSTNGSGVWGQTASTTRPGVRGVSTASNGIGVRGEANAAGSVGVWGQSNANTGVYGLSTDGIGVWGQSTNGAAMRADGKAVQARDQGGWVKAMVYINYDGSIVRCYNGVTGASDGGCGFTVTKFTRGGYGVDFGVQVNDRFIIVTPKYCNDCFGDFPPFFTSDRQRGANYYFPGGSTTVNVITFKSETRDAAEDSPFMIVVF